MNGYRELESPKKLARMDRRQQHEHGSRNSGSVINVYHNYKEQDLPTLRMS